MPRLEGKTAMVVGAGSIGPGWGNGKATAVTFARVFLEANLLPVQPLSCWQCGPTTKALRWSLSR